MSWKYDDKNAALPVLQRKIPKSFWAAAWNKNLENYTDFFNNIGGFSKKNEREYNSGVLNRLSRTIIDIEIKEGVAKAIIMGYANSTYDVKITVQQIPQEKCNYIISEVGSKISNVGDLAAGKFPHDLSDKLLNYESGLFPLPEEIKCKCSCGKRVNMCTHSAVALYGIGLKFDDDPLLFFKLRGVPFAESFKKAIDEKISDMIAKTKTVKTSDRVIASENISDIFGVANLILA